MNLFMSILSAILSWATWDKHPIPAKLLLVASALFVLVFVWETLIRKP